MVIPPGGTGVSGGACPTSQPTGDVYTAYNGHCATVVEESGNVKKSCADGAGRATQVFEPAPSSNSSFLYETDYTYDPLGNLIQVLQKGNDSNSADWRVRKFNYNSLSQLAQAFNPESGSVSYNYDADGNLSSKTEPLPNQIGSATGTITYCYDALNRLKGKKYASASCPLSSPDVSYSYDSSSHCCLARERIDLRQYGPSFVRHDGLGRFEAWTSDTMGRPFTDQRTSNGVTYSTSYRYNLDGTLKTLTYPLGLRSTIRPVHLRSQRRVSHSLIRR